MAVAYDIKAIPTVYGARQFRSRLEAKWASFFDLAGWAYEYEPFDLGEWSPDFLLRGHVNVLVEVKPITAFDRDTGDRMARAAEAGGWAGDLLLLGVAPVFRGADLGCWDAEYSLGWFAEYCGPDYPGFFFGPCATCVAPNGLPDFHSDEFSYSGRMHGARYKENKYPEDAAWLKSIWDRAANRVQWQKNRGSK